MSSVLLFYFAETKTGKGKTVQRNRTGSREALNETAGRWDKTYAVKDDNEAGVCKPGI